MTRIVRPGGGILVLSVSILDLPSLEPAAFQELCSLFERANARFERAATSAEPEMMLDDQTVTQKVVEVSLSRSEFENGLRNDAAFLKWRQDDPQGLEKEMTAMLDKVWSFVRPAESNITLRLLCIGKLGRKVIF